MGGAQAAAPSVNFFRIQNFFPIDGSSRAVSAVAPLLDQMRNMCKLKVIPVPSYYTGVWAVASDRAQAPGMPTFPSGGSYHDDERLIPSRQAAPLLVGDGVATFHSS